MTPRSLVMAGLVALAVHHPPLLGQSPPQVGDAVRFMDPAATGDTTAPWQNGELQQLRNDTLWAQVPEGVVAMSLLDVEAQVRVGNHGTRGLWMGVAAGALIGGIMGAATYEPRFGRSFDDGLDCIFGSLFGVECAPETQRNSRLGDTLRGAAGGGLLGGGLGWLVGRALPKWARIDAVRVTSSAVGFSGRLGH